MQDLPPDPAAPRRRKLLWAAFFWLLWGAFLIVWTIGLLSSVPVEITSSIPRQTRFYSGKTLHVAAYAFLAAVVCWLPSRWGVRAALWLGLVGHGALTEYLQQFVEGRTGQLSDVGLDAAGVLLGLAAGLAVRRLTGRA